MGFRLLTATLCVAVFAEITGARAASADPVPVPVLTDAEERCSRATAQSVANYLEAVFNARQSCFNKVWRKQLPATVNCRASVDVGTGNDATDQAITNAEASLAVQIQTKCLNVSIEKLGFPGLCPDPAGPPYDTFDHEQCLLQKANETIDRLLDVEHPPLPAANLTSEDLTCQDTIATKASNMFRKEVERRSVLCEQRRIEGAVAADVNCRAELDPLAPGTGSAQIDSNVVLAHDDVLRGIAVSCERADLTRLGFPHRCPRSAGSLFSVAALTECMYVSHHRRLVEFVDTVLPLTRMCGDCGIDGENNEQCDDGDNAWVRGDICRTDCSVVTLCGDPDDSGSVTVRDSLIILRTAIALETCHKSLCDVNGDGVINSTDALLTLRKVVGIGVTFACVAPDEADLVCPVP